MSYAKLFFNSVPVTVDDEGNAVIAPNFICPNCQKDKHVTQKTAVSVATTQFATCRVDEDTQKPVELDVADFNKLQTFVLPCCGTKVELYVALHKEKGKPLQICVQRSDVGKEIPKDWWVIRNVEEPPR